MFFFIPNFSHLKSKLLAFMFSKDTRDLAYIVENLSKKKTNQALFDYVGKNTKYIVICAAADWTKYSSVIIFVNFFFSFWGPIIYFIKERIPSKIMHFTEFFPSKWDLRCCFTRQHQRTSGHRAT